MILRSAPCGPLEANCYIVAAEEGGDCVIIDPGVEAAGWVKGLLCELQVTPVAILATHGHFDHAGDAGTLGSHYGIPTWIHSLDQPMLHDPGLGLDPMFAAWVTKIYQGGGFPPPERVEVLDGREKLEVAGLSFTIIHAPGHTEGGVLYRLDDPKLGTLVFTGDVLFAGAIGRTDLPVGSPAAMKETLTGVVLNLPDSARILPGHGPDSTIERERATNPYLTSRFLAG